jgi:hypothetical protein
VNEGGAHRAILRVFLCGRFPPEKFFECNGAR